MNGLDWRKAGAAAALSMTLAAPAHAFLQFGDDEPANLEPATEYFNAKLGEFFVSVSAGETAALDTGSAPGWERTGHSFYTVDGPARVNVANGSRLTAVPVCRYFIPPASHFLSVSAAECAAVGEGIPGAVLETEAAFFAFTPRDDGGCPQLYSKVGGLAFAPVYRLWDSIQGIAHRYTTVKEVRDAMVENGWISEGNGPDGVAMCVPAFGTD